MRDVMVDIETLGTRPGSAILSIGAVAFDPDTGTLGAEHYGVVSLASSLAFGATVDAETVAWWGRQTPEAQRVLFEALSPNADSLHVGLSGLTAFLRSVGDVAGLRIWGNGSDFDNVLLSAAYQQAGTVAPWAFWNNRCFRTAKNMFRGFEPSREGEHHNALDDARHQARHALAISAARQALRRAA
ncbi:MAG TPA: 3'-5' exonuclease [Brevundimonas sp.]|nr:3'-5' exonuclease [Brevundimonas sp.]